MPKPIENRIYWLEGFEGPCKGGFFYRSSTGKDIESFEEKFDREIVAVKLDTKYETGKASYNIEFIVKMTDEEIEQINTESQHEENKRWQEEQDKEAK